MKAIVEGCNMRAASRAAARPANQPAKRLVSTPGAFARVNARRMPESGAMIAVPKCKIAESQVEIAVLPFAGTVLLYIHSAWAMVLRTLHPDGAKASGAALAKVVGSASRAAVTQSRH
jgi:hypothetical protein